MANLSWISSNPDYINQMIRNTQVTLSNNYNDLDNIPIIKITSTTNNPQKIWELKEGLYMIDGVVQVDNNTSYEVSNLLISMTARLENGKYILSAFIPYLRGLFEYILKTNSTEYEQHQKIVLMIKNDTLTLDNETIYTPIEDYHPATKKYVDDKANEIVAELDRMGVNKENLESLNKENRIRDIKLQALLSETSDRNITIEENVRYFDMPLSIDNGIVTINEIIGETLVNVCDQEEPVAITKSYTIENENHIALQGEYDGSCRPVVYGNTLVNHNADWNGKVQTGVETSASGIEDVVVEGIKGQEVSVVVEGNTVLNHALGKTSAVVDSVEDNLITKLLSTRSKNIIFSNGYIERLNDQTDTAWSFDTSLFKPNTIYTVYYDIIINTLDCNVTLINNTYMGRKIIQTGFIGSESYTFTSPDTISSPVEGWVDNINAVGDFKFSIKIYEGDHITNPKYVNSNEGNYVDLTVANDMSSVVEIEGRTMVNLHGMTVNSYSEPSFVMYNSSEYINMSLFKPSTTYTIVTKDFTNKIVKLAICTNISDYVWLINTSYKNALTFTTPSTFENDKQLRVYYYCSSDNSFTTDDIGKISCMIFEGDLTQTPHFIPSGYVEGLKSSYECEVTEDGKYKVDVKVTGKNKLHLPYTEQNKLYTDSGSWESKFSFNVIKDKTYTFSLKSDFENVNGSSLTWALTWSSSFSTNPDNQIYKSTSKTTSYTFTADKTGTVYFIGSLIGGGNEFWDFQLEEGAVATSYEPYFESTKTFYLNSPLLEGDKIVTKNGKLYHYHKMGKVVLDGSRNWWKSTNANGITFMSTTSLFNLGTSDRKILCDSLRVNQGINQETLTDYNEILAHKSSSYSNACYISTQLSQSDFINWLKSNPITVVYELDTPYYELIDEYNNTILNIPKNVAHLTHTSAVPVNNTVFTNYKDELNVLEPNTQYRVMFDCDTANIPFTVTLGGTSQEVTSKKGTHSLLITTPSTLVDKNLVIDGIGRCGIDNIRIFEGDVEYDYVKGLWSGYEERRLKNLCKVNYIEASKVPNNHNWNALSLDNLIEGYTYTFIATKTPYHTRLLMYYGDKGMGGLLLSNYSDNEKVIKSFKKTNTMDYIGIVTNNPGTETYYAKDILILEGDWTDNPPTYEEVMANEGKYAVKVKLDTNATIFGKGGRL